MYEWSNIRGVYGILKSNADFDLDDYLHTSFFISFDFKNSNVIFPVPSGINKGHLLIEWWFGKEMERVI